MFKKLRFEYRVYLNMKKNCVIEMALDDKGRIDVTVDGFLHHYEEKYDKEDSLYAIRQIEELSLETWQDEYHPEGYIVLDGYSWEVELEEMDPERTIVKRGYNAYPWCFYKLLGLLIDSTDPIVSEILRPHVHQMECFYDPMEGKPYDLDEEKIIEYLESHIGEKITSSQLIEKTNSYIGDQKDPNYFELHRQLTLIAEKNSFILDFSEHDGKEEGLPYNFDFVIIKMSDRLIKEV